MLFFRLSVKRKRLLTFGPRDKAIVAWRGRMADFIVPNTLAKCRVAIAAAHQLGNR